jgi:hypothetical protein
LRLQAYIDIVVIYLNRMQPSKIKYKMLTVNGEGVCVCVSGPRPYGSAWNQVRTVEHTAAPEAADASGMCLVRDPSIWPHPVHLVHGVRYPVHSLQRPGLSVYHVDLA